MQSPKGQSEAWRAEIRGQKTRLVTAKMYIMHIFSYETPHFGPSGFALKDRMTWLYIAIGPAVKTAWEFMKLHISDGNGNRYSLSFV